MIVRVDAVEILEMMIVVQGDLLEYFLREDHYYRQKKFECCSLFSILINLLNATKF